MIFGTKVKELEATVARLSAVIVAVGLKPEATVADVDALAAESEQAVDARVASATEPLRQRIDALTQEAATAQASSAEAAEQLAQAQSTLATSQARLTTIRSGLAAAGVHLAAEVDGAELTAEAVAQAIEARTSAGAARIVAGAGHEPLAIAADSEAASDPDSIRDRLRHTSDPREAGRLAQQLIDMRDPAAGRN